MTPILLLCSMIITTVSGFNMAISPGGTHGDGGSYSRPSNGHDYSGTGDGLGHSPSTKWEYDFSKPDLRTLQIIDMLKQQELDRIENEKLQKLPAFERERILLERSMTYIAQKEGRLGYANKIRHTEQTDPVYYNNFINTLNRFEPIALDLSAMASVDSKRPQTAYEINHQVERFRTRSVSLEKAQTYLRDSSLIYEKDPQTASFFLELSNLFMDIATGVTPGVSWVRDVYEAFSGYDFISGEPLNYFGQISAVAGVVTGGLGSKLLRAIKLYDKVISLHGLKRVIEWNGGIFTKREIIDWHGLMLGNSFSIAPVSTMHGLAEQGLDMASLAAKFHVEKGGLIYKVGTRGISETNQSQFWSIGNPLQISNFGKKYGIKPDNLKDANFLQTAEIKRDSQFITRVAEGGTSIEVVAPVSSIRLGSVVYISAKDLH